MADIILTFSTTAAQDAKLAKVLARVNVERLAQGEAEFADIEEYLRWVVIEGVKSYVRSQQEIDSEEVTEAFEAASDSVQDQVKTLLNVT